MKKFILQTMVFVTSCISIVVIPVILRGIILKNQSLKISGEKNILIIGDSTTECAINDSILKNSINLSKSGTSYFYSYLKLKQTTDQENNIKTVILSFGPHNIFKAMEKKWLLNDINIRSNLHKYYPFMEKDDLFLLLKKNRKGVEEAFSTIFKESIKDNVRFILGYNITIDYGKYHHLERDKLNTALSDLKKRENITILGISEIEKLYIQKIIKECQKKNLKLCFINTPKRAELWNSENYGVAQFYSYYSKNFPHIPFLDYHDFKIPDYGYGDLMHLNYKGAEIFSKYIEEQGIKKLVTKAPN